MFCRIYDDKFEAHVPSPKAGGGLIKYSRAEWLALIKALVLGIEHFNFHGRVWKPMEYENPGIPGFEAAGNPTDAAWDEETAKGESFVADGQQLRHVHVTTAMTGGQVKSSKTRIICKARVAGKRGCADGGLALPFSGVHTGDGPQLLKLEGCDLKPTGKEVVWPVEWWTLTINAQKVPPSLVRLKFVKVLDASRCSTGGYSLVPGPLPTSPLSATVLPWHFGSCAPIPATACALNA